MSIKPIYIYKFIYIVMVDLSTLLYLKQKEKTVPPVLIPKTYTNTLKIICPFCDFEHPEKVMMPMQIKCGNCGNDIDIAVTRTATGQRIQLADQSLPHDEYVFTYSTKSVGVIDAEDIPLESIKTIEEAEELYLAGKLPVNRLQELVTFRGWGNELWFWANGYDGKFYHTDRNPFNPEGDNTPREHGFTNSPYIHIAGLIFQVNIKSMIRNLLSTGYGTARKLYGKDRANHITRWILRRIISIAPGTIKQANNLMRSHYDKDAFVFEGDFIPVLHELFHRHIDTNLQWEANTAPSLREGTDTALVILKEDMPYRICVKLLLNDLIKENPNGFALTPLESKHYLRMQKKIADRKAKAT